MQNNIHIMLIEDNAAYRKGIACALDNESDISLMNQFGTAEIALRTLQNASGNDMPDLILLDLNLPSMSGLDSITWIKQYSPNTKILILTQSNMEADLLCAIQRGADGYLLKSTSVEDLITGIHEVMNGGASIDPGLARVILNTLQKKLPTNTTTITLSQRESEVLALVADGLLKKQVAHQLGVSQRTVATHMEHIYKKLQVQNAPAAISKAYQLGLIDIQK
ncbi:response regulator transcription factor [Coraliomargarita algicola]|uniref:Response regulator transcription factor n=1 Tax=Coraliomargarita algicola TaxID=3092156 RepID=A0ABZ0RM17_9BACT|nr:response regulator transcription factor [Coraliomargarita sp. J2-16]WPJ96279.1 response regulator transcription factor [Coraliomargarita sp. J2-16]